MNAEQLKLLDDLANQVGSLVQGFSALLAVTNENVRNLDIIGLAVQEALPEALEKAMQQYAEVAQKQQPIPAAPEEEEQEDE